MADIASSLTGRLSEPELNGPLVAARQKLTSLIDDSAYVGEEE